MDEHPVAHCTNTLVINCMPLEWEMCIVSHCLLYFVIIKLDKLELLVVINLKMKVYMYKPIQVCGLDVDAILGRINQLHFLMTHQIPCLHIFIVQIAQKSSNC